jgi:transcriptional repressor NrdR
MNCPYCEAENKSRVVDTTRDKQGGIRRRRECKQCGRRFSTYERVLVDMPLLIKSTGDREAFDREKLINGIQIACAKRPIPAAGITDLVHRIETHLQQSGKGEVSSRVVGDMVIEGLKDLDPIAYIRYAIVYLGLDSLGSVRDMIDSMLADNGGSPGKPAPATPPTPDSGSASNAVDDQPVEKSSDDTRDGSAGGKPDSKTDQKS